MAGFRKMTNDIHGWLEQQTTAGWWCNVPILKNDGVKVNGLRMTSRFYEMEDKRPCSKQPDWLFFNLVWIILLLTLIDNILMLRGMVTNQKWYESNMLGISPSTLEKYRDATLEMDWFSWENPQETGWLFPKKRGKESVDCPFPTNSGTHGWS